MNKLKIGQRVKVIKDTSPMCALAKIGDTGTIKKINKHDCDVLFDNGQSWWLLPDMVEPIEQIKPQKLVRKYRFLKPHEKIQYGDWCNAKTNPSSTDLTSIWPFQGNGWVPVTDCDDYIISKKTDYNTNIVIARFVDCVPVTK